jgi:outer membrane protein assembly factor BamB
MKTLRAAVVLAGVVLLAGGDWARFRGPNGSGAADATGIPEKWTVEKDTRWKIELPGPGNGSPIVCGGKVYLQAASADATNRWLLCYDAKTGHKDWEAPVSGHKPADKGMHPKNSLASSTPAYDGERVYAIFWDGTDFSLHAYDLSGKPVWYKDLGEYKSQHGVGSSPIVHAGKVFVNFDQDGAAELLAFDAKTGETAWAMKRKAFRACYSSPFVRNLPGGQTELVVDSTQGITAYDPGTGRMNWTWDWVFPNASLRTVGGPLLVGDVIVAISGDGDGSRDAVAISAGPGAKRLWGLSGSKRGNSPYVPMPVAKGDYVYWVHDKGRAACLEARTGKELWNESLPNITREFSASLILTGDRVTAIAEDGKVYVFRASPKEYESLWRTSIGEPVFATPAVADGKLFIRTARHLICIGGK